MQPDSESSPIWNRFSPLSTIFAGRCLSEHQRFIDLLESTVASATEHTTVRSNGKLRGLVDIAEERIDAIENFIHSHLKIYGDVDADRVALFRMTIDRLRYARQKALDLNQQSTFSPTRMADVRAVNLRLAKERAAKTIESMNSDPPRGVDPVIRTVPPATSLGSLRKSSSNRPKATQASPLKGALSPVQGFHSSPTAPARHSQVGRESLKSEVFSLNNTPQASPERNSGNRSESKENTSPVVDVGASKIVVLEENAERQRLSSEFVEGLAHLQQVKQIIQAQSPIASKPAQPALDIHQPKREDVPMVKASPKPKSMPMPTLHVILLILVGFVVGSLFGGVLLPMILRELYSKSLL